MTIINDEFCIFINKGVIEEQESYLESLVWRFMPETKWRAEYFDAVIEYRLYFIVFHEYAYIFCGHVDARLCGYEDKKEYKYKIRWNIIIINCLRIIMMMRELE